MVRKIIVKKVLTDEQTKKLEGTRLPKGYFKKVIKKENVDIYTDEGELLLKYRHNVIPKKNVELAYDNIISHARKLTSTRGMFGGPKSKSKNTKVATNIVGYFDTLSMKQKQILREANMKLPKCRPTAFNIDNPKEWEKFVPFIQDINNQYKKLFPKEYEIQKKDIKNNKYIINNTIYSTITTNLNVHGAVHTDKGDYSKGFGNLVVIDKGNYKGGFTGFPQYGVAVDVRSGDFVGMDVHKHHGNEPIICKKGVECERLSFVSYLREGIIKNCKNEPMIPYDYFKQAKKTVNKKRSKRRLKEKNRKKSNRK